MRADPGLSIVGTGCWVYRCYLCAVYEYQLERVVGVLFMLVVLRVK